MSSSIFVTGRQSESHADIDLYVIDLSLKKKDQVTNAMRIRLKEAPTKEMVKSTADVINDRICKFFDVTDSKDALLFRSIFFQDELDRFYFCRNEDRIVNKIVLSKEWIDFCTIPKAPDFPKLIPNTSKLTIVTKFQRFPEKTLEVSFSDLAKVSDLQTAALYNCNGFKGYSEKNKDLGWSRIIEKISFNSKL